jgi:hypothetical protein
VNDANSINAEIEGGPYLGLAGRYDTGSGSGFPASLYTGGGIGWQRTWGDWAIGAELWGFAEPFSSMATPAGDFPQGPFGNWGPGAALQSDRDQPQTVPLPGRRFLSDRSGQAPPQYRRRFPATASLTAAARGALPGGQLTKRRSYSDRTKGSALDLNSTASPTIC